MNQQKVFQKTTSQLYRDCLRLSNHIAGNSPKGYQIRRIIKKEFLKNSNEIDPIKIDSLKGNAIRALTNYLMMESSLKDTKLNQHVKNLNKKDIESLKQQNSENKYI